MSKSKNPKTPQPRPAAKPSSPYGNHPVQRRTESGDSAPSRTSRPASRTQSQTRPSAATQRPAPGTRPNRTAGPTSKPTPTPLPQLPIPCAQVTRRASESLRNGHVWVYSSDVEHVETEPNTTPGLTPVVDNRGIPLGTALYSPSSQIALRLVSREILTEKAWLELLATRIHTAVARRNPLLNEKTNACRLVFSEADELPGIIVDKYADIVVIQLLAKGLDTRATRAACVEALSSAIKDPELTIWERPDPRIRELEGLSAPSTTPLLTRGPECSSTTFRLNGLSFQFDVNSGQKTGAFLDQRQNYVATAEWAKSRGTKRALDVCTYQGGFALHLAQTCRQVTGIDASHSSLEVAERNLELNRKDLVAEVDWIEADAFELLRALSEERAEAPWDLIVLDPPAFAKSKRAVEGALRGYKELNLRALRMLAPGGLLITCSCSHHVSLYDLESTVASAAQDAHRRVTVLERRGASLDHPHILNLPETEYLKCLILQVD